MGIVLIVLVHRDEQLAVLCNHSFWRVPFIIKGSLVIEVSALPKWVITWPECASFFLEFVAEYEFPICAICGHLLCICLPRSVRINEASNRKRLWFDVGKIRVFSFVECPAEVGNDRIADKQHQ